MDNQSRLDPKKRALEALERRFAFSKAELETQNKRRRPKEEEGKKRGDGGDAPEASQEMKPLPSKIGKFVFCGSTSQKAPIKTPGQGPAYVELPENFHENLLHPGENLSQTGVNAVNRVMHDLLQNGEVAQKYMQGSRNIKIDNWVLLDNLVPNDFSSATARMKALQNHSKRSKKHMSMKEHKKLGSFNLSPTSHKHELFKPLHELWKDYITKLLKESGKNQMPQRLLAADLHGAILLVVQCKQPAFNGFHGIMIRETAETFGIVSEDDIFRVVPKKGSIFIFQAGSFKITVVGDKLSRRNSCCS